MNRIGIVSDQNKKLRMRYSDEHGTSFSTKQSSIYETVRDLVSEMVKSAMHRRHFHCAKTDITSVDDALYRALVDADILVYNQEYQMTNTVICSPRTFRLFRQSDRFILTSGTAPSFVDNLTGLRTGGEYAGQWRVFVGDAFQDDGQDQFLVLVHPKRPRLLVSEDGETKYDGPESGMVVVGLSFG